MYSSHKRDSGERFKKGVKKGNEGLWPRREKKKRIWGERCKLKDLTPRHWDTSKITSKGLNQEFEPQNLHGPDLTRIELTTNLTVKSNPYGDVYPTHL